MTDTEYNIEEDIRIDPDALDLACLQQANLLAKYSKLSADAKRKADLFSEKLKTLRSELILDANEDPQIMGEKIKPTAPNVEAYYRTHKDYITLKKKVIQAEHNSEILHNFVFAIQARGRMLDNLIQLLKSEYFQAPEQPLDLSREAIQKKKRGVTNEKAKTLKRKIRKVEK